MDVPHSGVSVHNLWITIFYSLVTLKYFFKIVYFLFPDPGRIFFVIFITRLGFDIFSRCMLVLLYEENK